MALTATVSMSTRKEVSHLLGMVKSVMISKSPHKPNIIYTVEEKDIEEVFAPFVEQVYKKKTEMEKIITFGRTCNY